MDDTLSPRQRRILRWSEAGMPESEIAWRFRRTPRYVRQVLVLARLPRTGPPRPQRVGPLRPLERRLLRWRDQGVSYAELAARFRRSPAFLRRVEAIARLKLAS